MSLTYEKTSKKYSPQEIKDAKLEKGVIIAKNLKRGITVLTQKDKQDVYSSRALKNTSNLKFGKEVAEFAITVIENSALVL